MVDYLGRYIWELHIWPFGYWSEETSKFVYSLFLFCSEIVRIRESRGSIIGHRCCTPDY